MQYQAISRISPAKTPSNGNLASLNGINSSSSQSIDINNGNSGVSIIKLGNSDHYTHYNNTSAEIINKNVKIDLSSDDSGDDASSKKSSANENDDTDEVNYSNLNHQKVLIEKQGGLSNKTVLIILTLWYLFSALTLFTNKYIVTYNKGDPTLLGNYYHV